MNAQAAAEAWPKCRPANGAFTPPETAAAPLHGCEEARVRCGIDGGKRVLGSSLGWKSTKCERRDYGGERQEAFHKKDSAIVFFFSTLQGEQMTINIR